MSRRERRLLRQSGKKYVKNEEAHRPVSEQSTDEAGKHEHAEHKPKEKKGFDVIGHIYDTQYKKLLIIPFAIIIIAIIILFANFAMTGEFMNKGISLKGGISLTVQTDQAFDIEDIESFLQSHYPGNDIEVRKMTEAGKITGFIIDADLELNSDSEKAKVEQDEFEQIVDSKIPFIDEKKGGSEYIGGALSKSFFKQIIIALIIAFIFMGLVVFFYFRTFAPSIAVILAATSDIIVTLAIVDFIGMKLSTAGVAAFLMLIGYSVDTDILLSTRVLKSEQGSVLSRIYNAMKTGLTMTFTTMAALIVVLIFSQSVVLKQIMLILLIGLIVDLIMTWFQNTGILRLYMEKRKRH